MDSNRPPDFDQIADTQVKRAFLGRGPDSIELLPAGTKLYKWSKSLLGRNGISPWWLFLESRTLSNGARCDGLKERQEYARRLSVSDRNFHRVRAGVTRQWNPMTSPIVIRLNCPAWAYIGKAAGQLEDSSVSNVYLIAGDYQAWIPGLKAVDVTQIAALPYLAPR